MKDLDPEKVLIWIAPGAFIALFRSYFLKGTFPTIGKDDLAAFVVGSVIYRFAALGLLTQEQIAQLSTNGWFWFFFVGGLPCALGFGLGIFEASDWIGKIVRWCGVSMPTPTPTAWETLFRELPASSFLFIILKDGTIVYGKWTKDGISSSASSDGTNIDIFIGEIGRLDSNNRYVANSPKRGMYIAAGEIRDIEVIVRGK